ncbi:TlpA family protein disulfide reductase [Flavobacterium sp. J27]|uniref:TlpA family protein disulfide reductase n=1 Tax=Flavobacterium sp. J27 TaxID=2060419 RepID=UPI0010318343|nr:TlpA family protein disulfide reductase [Flavobacterium sp. J27]
MKKIIALLSLALFITSCSNAQDTEFKKEALENVMTTTSKETITFKEILEKYKGKTIVIDVWASWCPDCIKGMPKVKTLQKEFPEATYVFISMDKNYDSWLKGIEKYEVKGEHYLTSDGMKGVFGTAIQLDWIPRYMIVNKEGKIVLFKAIEADDNKLINTLKKAVI